MSKEKIERMDIWEFERFSETSDSNLDIYNLNYLSVEKLKGIITVRTRKVEDLYKDAEREYDHWVLKGKSAVHQAAKEFLKPGEKVEQLEKFIGNIPADFLGGGSFESSSIYKKWAIRIDQAKVRLENAKTILAAKAKEKFGFPDITVEQEEATLTSNRREAIPDNVKMQVWKRDSGRCVKCGSQEKLEYDHIIPVSKGGSNTARNIQLLCEKCNRLKGGSII